MKKKACLIVAAPEPLMSSELHQRIDAMGLKIMSYQKTATLPDANGSRWWIPRHIAGSDFALIIWKEAGAVDSDYHTAGWDAQLGPHTHGSHYTTLGAALAWIETARGVRDGIYSDFLRRLVKRD